VLLNLLQEFIAEPQRHGANQIAPVVRGFGAGVRVPVGFTQLQNQWSANTFPGVNPATQTGAPLNLVRGFGTGLCVPAGFTNLQNGWGSPGVFQQPPTAIFGDTYQPRAQHGVWKARPSSDNPGFLQSPPNAAIFGDSYSPIARWKTSRVVFGTAAPEPPPAVLWGDCYAPRSQFQAWTSRPVIGNPAIGQPTFTAITGDGYLPRSQFHAWLSRLVNDNPGFLQLAAPSAVWGDYFNAFGGIPRQNFKGSRISGISFGAGLTPEEVITPPGQGYRKIITLRGDRIDVILG